MPRISSQELSVIEARLSHNRAKSDHVEAQHADKESKLHDLIIADCKIRRWYVVHSRFGKPTTQNAGVPDLIIAARSNNSMHYNGKTFWLELKKKGGKLTPEQTITRHILLGLGHHYATIYSFEQYLKFVDDNL